ncbi:cation:proton antiporter domain-containing protein [Nocardioides limicola]|uniref:cation:proton antiporter domain-containing protein n=1 Tax=Nocardioides limicola TaxID=2803368 RepID=UPI001EF0EF56|nr:cation:proton antiporter [Nocardioides sp. DJM-14]
MAAELVALGAAGLAAGTLARGGRRLALPTIPSYMVAGILLGPSVLGVISDVHSLELVAAIGLIVLLFHLGVEFPLEQVMSSGRRVLATAFGYIGLNVGGGLALGFALGWGTAEALVIAGAVGISSSAIVTKLMVELRRLANTETPVILGVIVVEDLFLAVYLAVLAPFLGGAETAGEAALQFGVALGFIIGLFLLARYAAKLIGMLVGSDDNELLIVLVIGLAVFVAGVAEMLGVSDAIGALMIGLVISRTAVKERVERLILPIRDAFAAIFFVVFGASIPLDAVGEIALPVAAAVVLTIITNTLGGLLLARIYRLNQRAATNAALALVGRGEFSLILATMAIAAGLDDRIGPFVALYVLILAFAGPLLSTRSRHLSKAMPTGVLAGYRYVEQETMAEPCAHLIDAGPAAPVAEGCVDCLAAGDEWVHLRVCLGCGYVGCCDDSTNRHATGHHEASGHPCIASMEPGEDWRYCYPDRVLIPDPEPPVFRPASAAADD